MTIRSSDNEESRELPSLRDKAERLSQTIGRPLPLVSRLRQATSLVTVVMIGLFLAWAIPNLFENLDAEQLMVIQSPISGELSWYLTPGIKPQWFGRVTKYHKRSQFWFSAKPDQGGKVDESIQVRFNDGGHARISGSIAWELPQDERMLNLLHTKYGSHPAVEQQLVRTVVEKAIYMTGPLMSSKESYAERRNDLLALIEDQIQRGVFQTETIPDRQKDPITGIEKTVYVVRILKNSKGEPLRSDRSPLEELGLRTFNLSINQVAYDATVEKQIQQQQQATMQVQIAVVEAKRAEQEAITAVKQGEANAAKAKWEQETIKAKAVTEAEQRKAVAELKAHQELEVAKLDAMAAEQFKQAETFRGEGEGARRKLVMDADGALTMKLEAWTKVNQMYAEAIAKHVGAWVPQVVIGGSHDAAAPASGAQQLIELLLAKTAKDLAVDLRVANPPANR